MHTLYHPLAHEPTAPLRDPREAAALVLALALANPLAEVCLVRWLEYQGTCSRVPPRECMLSQWPWHGASLPAPEFDALVVTGWPWRLDADAPYPLAGTSIEVLPPVAGLDGELGARAYVDAIGLALGALRREYLSVALPIAVVEAKGAPRL